MIRFPRSVSLVQMYVELTRLAATTVLSTAVLEAGRKSLDAGGLPFRIMYKADEPMSGAGSATRSRMPVGIEPAGRM